MEVVWLKEATEDLKEIGLFIEQESPQTAYRILVKIKACVDSLKSNPELGRLGRVSRTRELVIAGLPYIIPYTIKNKQIRILAVMHTSRKWPGQF